MALMSHNLKFVGSNPTPATNLKQTSHSRTSKACLKGETLTIDITNVKTSSPKTLGGSMMRH